MKLSDYTMLHASRNKGNMVNSLEKKGLHELRRRLPPGWRLDGSTRLHDSSHDARLVAPNGQAGLVAFKTRARLEPKDIPALAEAGRSAPAQVTLIVICRYLSEATRARLRERELGYIDLTGNIRVVVPEPGLFIEAQGATEDPDREERPARSLRGPKAGRIMRVLVDRKQPPGVRELAALTNSDAGYVSRVLIFLDGEALITRVGHGRIQSVDWPALLRRRAREAPLESLGEARTYLDPRGVASAVARLASSDERYAITASLAAAAFAPIAPARLATIWIRDAAAAAPRIGLRPAETGANVLLIEPNDEGVFDGAAERDGAWYAAPSQIALDLLTSPGRGPAEGAELMNWMREHEDAWRR